MSHIYIGDAGGGDPQISNHFTLADLTRTDQNADNSPDATSLINLKQLGQVLDTLYDTIGPFNVLSAFRSKAVEDALSASGQPTAEAAAGHISFHTVGLAADIYPTTMTLDEYFGKILAAMGTQDQPGPLWNTMAEVAYKPSQNSIHLAGAVTYRANNVILGLNSEGAYTHLTPEEIWNLASPYLQSAITNVEDVASEVVTSPNTKIWVFAGLGALLLFMMMHSSKKANA